MISSSIVQHYTLKVTQSPHKKTYIAIIILGALAMLFFQVYFIYSLNNKNESMLFCGDVITTIDTNAEDSK